MIAYMTAMRTNMTTVPLASKMAPAASGMTEAETRAMVTAAPVPKARTRVG
jgi:hypothetical protein